MATDEPAGLPVELGLDADGEPTHVYHVVQQRQARLLRKLFGEKGVISLDDLSELFDADDDAEPDFAEILLGLGGKVHDVLSVFIPELMPRWEWDGFASETAAMEDQYDEDADRSPSVPQQQKAFETVIQVNGLRWLRRLKDVIDPKLIKAQVNAWAATAVKQMGNPTSAKPSDSSKSLPQANGASDPTSSGTTDPTPPQPSPSGGPSESPSLGSTGS